MVDGGCPPAAGVRGARPESGTHGLRALRFLSASFDGHRVQCFRCHTCRQTFSQETFAFSYFVKRPAFGPDRHRTRRRLLSSHAGKILEPHCDDRHAPLGPILGSGLELPAASLTRSEHTALDGDLPARGQDLVLKHGPPHALKLAF